MADIYGFTLKTIDGAPQSLADYRDRVARAAPATSSGTSPSSWSIAAAPSLPASTPPPCPPRRTCGWRSSRRSAGSPYARPKPWRRTKGPKLWRSGTEYWRALSSDQP
jgi:hypothetical protein